MCPYHALCQCCACYNAIPNPVQLLVAMAMCVRIQSIWSYIEAKFLFAHPWRQMSWAHIWRVLLTSCMYFLCIDHYNLPRLLKSTHVALDIEYLSHTGRRLRVRVRPARCLIAYAWGVRIPVDIVINCPLTMFCKNLRIQEVSDSQRRYYILSRLTGTFIGKITIARQWLEYKRW